MDITITLKNGATVVCSTMYHEDAAAFTERIIEKLEPPPPPPPAPVFNENYLAHKINAIKAVREATKLGLKASKDLIEAILEAGQPSSRYGRNIGNTQERIQSVFAEYHHDRTLDELREMRESIATVGSTFDAAAEKAPEVTVETIEAPVNPDNLRAPINEPAYLDKIPFAHFDEVNNDGLPF